MLRIKYLSHCINIQLFILSTKHKQIFFDVLLRATESFARIKKIVNTSHSKYPKNLTCQQYATKQFDDIQES